MTDTLIPELVDYLADADRYATNHAVARQRQLVVLGIMGDHRGRPHPGLGELDAADARSSWLVDLAYRPGPPRCETCGPHGRPGQVPFTLGQLVIGWTECPAGCRPELGGTTSTQRPRMPCSPGMRACRLDCRHRASVQEYQAARQAWEDAAEHATALYAAELAAYRLERPPITFRTWLEQRQGVKA